MGRDNPPHPTIRRMILSAIHRENGPSFLYNHLPIKNIMPDVCITNVEYWFLLLWGPIFILVPMTGGFFIQRLRRIHGEENLPFTLREYTKTVFPAIFAGIISGTMVSVSFRSTDFPTTVMSLIIVVISTLGFFIYGFLISSLVLMKFDK